MHVGKALLGTALGLFMSVAAAAPFSNLYVFGDSLSDTGNMRNLVLAATGGATDPLPPPYFNGHFSNGPVAAEYLAAELGMTADPVALADGSINPSGTNFAVGGAATGPVPLAAPHPVSGRGSYSNYVVFSRAPDFPLDPGIQDQVGFYLAAGAADPGALYLLWGGANDAYIALEDPAIDPNDATAMNTTATATAVRAAANIATYIAALEAAGGQNFLVPNLPDLGRTPDALLTPVGTAYAGALTRYSDTFNNTLDTLLGGLASDVEQLVRFDVAALFDEWLSNSSINSTIPCITVATCVANDTGQYLFWDGVHPTTTYHRLLGLAMAAAVPEPATSALLPVGLLLVTGVLLAKRRLRV